MVHVYRTQNVRPPAYVMLLGVSISLVNRSRHTFHMATLQQQIAQRFLAKLAESKAVDAEKIDEIRKLLSQEQEAKTR
jgi:hypothetical protein